MDYFNALIRGDTLKVRSLFDCRKDSYHNGFLIDDFIFNEVKQFEKSCPYYDLYENGFTVRKTGRVNDKSYYSVINNNNKFVFEYSLTVDNNHIFPDNLSYQVVPKFLFYQNGNIKRSFAVWCPYSKSSPMTIIPKSKNYKLDQQQFNYSASTETDGFFSYAFKIQYDDFREKIIKFRFLDKQFAGNIDLRFPGKEHPYFFDNMFPIIDKQTVIIPDVEALVWSIAVFFDDGTNIHMEFPREKHILFNKSISKVILTDALDNDWESYRGYV